MDIKIQHEPAFPYERESVHGGKESCSGMTLRDYFAAKAMASLLVGVEVYSSNEITEQAYVIADKMLKERDKSRDE